MTRPYRKMTLLDSRCSTICFYLSLWEGFSLSLSLSVSLALARLLSLLHQAKQLPLLPSLGMWGPSEDWRVVVEVFHESSPELHELLNVRGSQTVGGNRMLP